MAAADKWMKMKTIPFELSVERFILASPVTVYRTWTTRLVDWWCPKPWTTELLELNLVPGGRSAMITRGPGGEGNAMESVILEVSPNERIVLTNAFLTGWIPQPSLLQTLTVFEFLPQMKDEECGTHYRVTSRHWDAHTQKQHEDMGFVQGWTIATDQLALLAETLQVQHDARFDTVTPGFKRKFF